MDTDTPEEQTRKLNERNFNTRVQTHIRDALGLAVLLQQRYSAPVTEPMPYSRALEFSSLLQKAYKGLIEPIGINPHLKEEAKEKKLSNQKTVAQVFPLLVKTIEGNKPKEIPPGQGPPIVIAPKRLVISLAESSVASRYEEVVEKKQTQLKQLDKNPAEGFKSGVTSHSVKRQGASISVIVQEFITLLRNLVAPAPKKPISSALSESELSFTR